MHRIGKSFFKVCCCSSFYCLFFLASCGGVDNPSQIQDVSQIITATASLSAAVSVSHTENSTETPLPPVQPSPAASTEAAIPQDEEVQFDACSLLDKVDVEYAVGRAVLDPKNEKVANLTCCSYGDPETPIISVATLCVFIGSDTEYFAGAKAQARDLFEMSRQNAASAQAVSGLGDDAYWDDVFGSLSVLQGIYELSLEIYMDVDDDNILLNVSKELTQQALLILP